MHGEEKLSAGLKLLTAKDKSESLSWAHAHRDKQEEKLSGAQSVVAHISFGLSEIVTGTDPAGVQTQKGFTKTNPWLVYTLYTSIAHSVL